MCQELDGQVFDSDDAAAGKNFPPMHPNCRSTTIMYDAEEPLKERTARDENGNRITVPGNMKYKEWLEKYHPELVDKAGESGIINNRNGVHAILGPEHYTYSGGYDKKVRSEVTDIIKGVK